MGPGRADTTAYLYFALYAHLIPEVPWKKAQEEIEKPVS